MRLRDDTEDTVRDGWESACLRYRHLLHGGELAPLPPGTLRLGPEETAHVDTMLGRALFTQHDPAELMAATGGAPLTWRASMKMDDMTTPRWRSHADVRAVLTSQRLLFDVSTWRVLWHDQLLEILGDAAELEFVLRYDGHENVLLYGSTAPFYAVVLAWLTYGPRGLSLPVFEAIAAEVGPQSS